MRRIKVAACAILPAFTLHGADYDKRMAAAGFVDVDTPYNRVIVLNGVEKYTGRVMRVMITGPHAWQSAMYLDDPSELALPYSRFYRLAKYFAPDMRRLLVLGGGGFSFPKYALENYQNVRVDVVELDPGITALAREQFRAARSPASKYYRGRRTNLSQSKYREIRSHPLRRIQFQLHDSLSPDHAGSGPSHQGFDDPRRRGPDQSPFSD